VDSSCCGMTLPWWKFKKKKLVDATSMQWSRAAMMRHLELTGFYGHLDDAKRREA
jgi:hypothetical protein